MIVLGRVVFLEGAGTVMKRVSVLWLVRVVVNPSSEELAVVPSEGKGTVMNSVSVL